MMKMKVRRDPISNQFPLIPVDCLATIQPFLNIELMTVQKSFHIANKEIAIKFAHDQKKKQIPEVIYL